MLSHILLWDKIIHSSVVLYFSLFYYFTLAGLLLHFFSLMPKYVTSSTSIPVLKGCLHIHRDATLSCKWAETAVMYNVLSVHTFSLQAAVQMITFNSAWNEIKLQTYTGRMKDEMTCLQTKINFKQQEDHSHSLPFSELGDAVWQRWNTVNDFLYQENVVWFPFTGAYSRSVLFCNIKKFSNI